VVKRGAYGVVIRRSDGNRRLGRTRQRWENNEMDLEEMG
jgi:ribonuclease HI